MRVVIILALALSFKNNLAIKNAAKKQIIIQISTNAIIDNDNSPLYWK